MATVAREAMSEEQFTRLLQFFQVFSNESRLRLIGHLANGERNVGELARLLDLKEPTVSHHLAELKGLGLVDVRAELQRQFQERYDGYAERMAEAGLDQDPGAWTKAVASPFDFPKQGEIVVRRTRANPKALSQFNEDYAVLRRYLVDSGYMARENGIYWRTPENDPAG